MRCVNQFRGHSSCVTLQIKISYSDAQRVILLDSDQVILKNIDDMMDMDLPEGFIAASHACTCNPRKLAHYSKDW